MSFWSRLLGRPTMDVLIAGVPRSGTSMLSNLMTSFPDTLIVYEPHLGRKEPSRYANEQMEELGLPRFASNRQLARFAARNAGRWGVKEVMTRHLRPTIEQYGAKRVVFVIRNIRHAAMSIYDRSKEIPHRFKPGWRGQGIVETAGFLVELHQRLPAERRVVVSYERFVRDAEHRREIAGRGNWRGTTNRSPPAVWKCENRRAIQKNWPLPPNWWPNVAPIKSFLAIPPKVDEHTVV